jgi:hypothetical protein
MCLVLYTPFPLMSIGDALGNLLVPRIEFAKQIATRSRINALHKTLHQINYRTHQAERFAQLTLQLIFKPL